MPKAKDKIDYKGIEKTSAKLALEMQARKNRVAGWLGGSDYEQIMKGTGHQDVVDNIMDSQINQVPSGMGLGFKKGGTSSTGPQDSIFATKALHVLQKKRKVSETQARSKSNSQQADDDEPEESKTTVTKKQKTTSFLDSYKKTKRKR